MPYLNLNLFDFSGNRFGVRTSLISCKPSLLLIPLVVLIRFIWPGDGSFINDEPSLLHMALDLNSSGKFYSLGLMGSKGVQYGPVPVWYYRLLLALTHDIQLVSFLHTFFITALTLTGVLKLIREIREFDSSLILVVFLSPFLWFYSRNMWDNPLNIPVVITGFSFYLSFLRKKDFFSLLITFLTLVVSIQIHLMAIPFAVSTLVHFAVFNHRWARANAGKFLSLSLFSLCLIFPYLHYLFFAPETQTLVRPQIDSFLFPFLGGDFFSARNFSYFLGEGWQRSITQNRLLSTALYGLTLFTGLSHIIIWTGILASLVYVWKHRERGDSMWHASFISLLAILIHLFLSLFKGLKLHPHYYNGVWVYSLFFLGAGLKLLRSVRGVRSIAPAYMGALFASLMVIIVTIHINHGSRSLHYGHTLNDLIAAAKKMNEYPEETLIYTATFHTKYFIRGIVTLRKFYPYSGEYKAASGIVLRYKQARNVNDGSLVVDVRP